VKPATGATKQGAPFQYGEKGTGYFLMEKLNAAGLARQQELEKVACPLFVTSSFSVLDWHKGC